MRYQLVLDGQRTKTLIVKSIKPPAPEDSNHPRGWNSSHSHQRKLRSYQVETHWYQHWASRCNEHCRVAQCHGVYEGEPGQTFIVLEDLDNAGFEQRCESLSPEQAILCLQWLAHFHAQFLHSNQSMKETGLWPTGSYWHLATRADELAAMANGPLKTHAKAIDQRLSSSPYLTLIHGDAKAANFCFDPRQQRVAAVDFQYVGTGCGMKDVVYFLGSCLSEQDCSQHYAELLDRYFKALKFAFANKSNKTNNNNKNGSINVDKLEEDWRELFPFAWADFHRFILGWAPQHWKNNAFSQQMAMQAIAKL